MNIKIIVRVVAVVAVASVALLIVSQLQKREADTDKSDSGTEISEKTSPKPEAIKKAVAGAGAVAGAVEKVSKTNSAATVAENSEKSEVKEIPPTTEELKVMEEIDEFVGDDEYRKIVQAARKIMDSSNPEVRREAADAFGWAGVQGIKDLQKMLTDSDPDVADDAFENWDSAVDEVEDDATRANLIADGIKNMKNQDNIESALMGLDNMDNNISVPIMVDVIQNGIPIAVEPTLEHYEFTTGEVYKSPEAAKAWVAKDMAE